VETQRALDQHGLALGVLGVGQAALDGADGLAGLVVVEADALGAELRVDHVDLVALGDGFVRALGLASAAVDAVGRDVGRHGGIRAGPRIDQRRASFRFSV
jgi:hypothetical protein